MKHHKIIRMGYADDYLIQVKRNKWVFMKCINIEPLTHKIIHNIIKKFKEQNIPFIDTNIKKRRGK